MANQQSRSSAREGPNGHVVHLTTVHHPQDPRISQKQLPTLQEAGLEVTLIATGRPADMPSGLESISLPPAEGRLERLGRQGQAYRVARSLDADVYQVHDPELLPLLFLLRRGTGAAVVYDMHEDYRSKGPVLGRALRALERWAFRWLDHVILAENGYTSIVEGEPVPSTCVLNYFKPIEDTERAYEPTTPHSDAPTRLLYTGTVASNRGLHTMVDVAAEIRRQTRKEKLRIVGKCHRPRQWTATERTKQAESLGSILTMVGGDAYVPKSGMVSHYHWADVGLALFEPSHNHRRSLPTKFYEYLHYGLPIICSDFPRWRAFVEQNECGVVVPPEDPGAVLDVLDRWQQEPSRYRGYVGNARAVAPQYRWAQMTEPLLEVYRGVLSGKRAT